LDTLARPICRGCPGSRTKQACRVAFRVHAQVPRTRLAAVRPFQGICWHSTASDLSSEKMPCGLLRLQLPGLSLLKSSFRSVLLKCSYCSRCLSHLAIAAFRAMSCRFLSLRTAALAGPPFFPPNRPSATAAGFFSGCSLSAFLVALSTIGDSVFAMLDRFSIVEVSHKTQRNAIDFCSLRGFAQERFAPSKIPSRRLPL